MDTKEKLDVQRREWEDMQHRGRIRYGLSRVLLWIGAWTLANDAFLILNQLGWWKQSGLPWKEILVAGVATGLSQAGLHWSDLERKFRTPPPEEDWMAR